MLTPVERTEVTDYVDACEYGLALETLVSIIDDENKAISKCVLDTVIEIARKMRLDPFPLADRLAKHVVQHPIGYKPE